MGSNYGLLKVMFNINSLISSLMLNYVAIFLTDYLVTGPIKDHTQAYNQSPPLSSLAHLPTLLLGTQLNISVLIVLPIVFIIYIMLTKLTIGYEISLLGSNTKAARYAGVNFSRLTVITMAMAGALAGLAGTFIVTGITSALTVGISQSYGYTGIGVALIASLNPLAAIPSALFFASLDTGGRFMNIIAGVPDALAQFIVALVIIVATLRQLLMERLFK